ncbi:CoA transferase [Streptomyces sp. NPDC050610]|uniref:CoA transferase n=1 Tax=Streptomyces sp. NPDC050610 TaxID=3157097 RepID=UPI00343EE7C1
MSHPLDGITVVSLEQAVAAPFATRQLADLGARVIKVERRGAGDFARGYDRTVHGQSSYFVWLNRGKESVELDLKAPEDRALLHALLARADVFVQNLAPGAADRLGLDAATLRAARPGLIHCSLSGYGPTGPYRAKKAYDLLVQCETGLVMATGTPAEPAKAGLSIADIATGMYAYSGILTALYKRERTGRGATLGVAMLDALGEWMSQPAYFSHYGGELARRTGARHPSISPYGPYRTGDGTVFLGVQNDREWSALCRTVLDRPELEGDPGFATNVARVAHDAEVTAAIESAFARLTAAEAVDLLDAAGIANATLRTPDELIGHPQLTARDRWRAVDTPGGPVRALLPPVEVEGREALMRPVPALGEHNTALRTEFGPRATGRYGGAADGRRDAEETVERRETILPGPARDLGVLLGVTVPDLDAGEGLPLLWHWLYLLDRPALTDLAADGHPFRGGVPAHPGPGRRRMWAGGRVRLRGVLRCGEQAVRRTKVLSVHEKKGRSGPLTFVVVGHRIEQRGEVVVEEEQDIVYRPLPAERPEPSAAAEPGAPVAASPDEWAIDVSPVLLFRFSALTYNAHRIHYDRDYCRDVEGYPGLLTHGPLQAIAMAEKARAGGVSGRVSFDYRLTSPLFDDQGMVVGAAPGEDGETVTAVRDAYGRRTATGTLRRLDR